MTMTAAGDRHRVSMQARLGRAPLLAWCTLGVALFAALLFWFDPTRMLTTLGDADDATRLVQVRELMAGRSWFDMTLPRFGGAYPLLSHWSRLIDLPIAVLLSAFELILPTDKAELVVRAVWPLTLLLAFVYLLARFSALRGGRAAALISIGLTVTCIFGIVQFLPGRIDHHNAMILCGVVGTLHLARSFDDPGAGWSAGFLLGLGTAVGYEAMALTAASLAAAVLFGMLPGRSLLGTSRAAVALAATLAVALAATTMPEALFVSHCDALSIDLVILSVCGATGICIVQAFEKRLTLLSKLLLLAGSGLVGLSLFGVAEPACLAGPFGQVDPALFPIWLGSVSEAQSMLSLGSKLPLVGGIAFIFFAAGIYSGLKLMRTDRDEGLRFQMIVLIIAIPLGIWQIKLLPYATFFTVPLLAASLARPPQNGRVPISKRGAGLMALSTLIVIAAASWLLMSLGAPSADRTLDRLRPIKNCQSTAAVTALAQVPKGLVVADVNLGPYLVALTDLDVLSAPYHRMSKSIIEAHRILHASPQAAERRLRAVGATYVVTCKGLDSTTTEGEVPADALQNLLFAGTPPAFLEPVTLDTPTPLKVWRVKP